jgi:integrase
MALKFAKLTRPALRTLQAGEKINEHGVTAERQKNGDVRFTVNVMVDGQRIHRVVGRESEGVTREQAERTIESLRTKAREGRLDLPTGRKAHRTFAEAADDYLARIEHHPKHGKNMKAKRQHMQQRLVPHFKALRPDKLTDFALAGYVKRRKEEGAALATINREMSTLSHFLSRAFDWKWTKDRLKVPKSAESRKKVVTLTEAEQQSLMNAAVGDQDPLTWLFVAIAMGTGMRHSEILRIRWEDIDADSRRIYIGKAKAGQREQPMPQWLATLLVQEREQRADKQGWAFPTKTANAKHPNRQSMAEQFARAVKRAKLDPAKVTPHVLRHTAITGLVRAGVDLPTIQKISGHKTLAMVLRYTHLTDDHVDQAVAKIESAFPDALTPELHTARKEERRGAA